MLCPCICKVLLQYLLVRHHKQNQLQAPTQAPQIYNLLKLPEVVGHPLNQVKGHHNHKGHPPVKVTVKTKSRQPNELIQHKQTNRKVSLENNFTLMDSYLSYIFTVQFQNYPSILLLEL